jgi:hypothetical protein
MQVIADVAVTPIALIAGVSVLVVFLPVLIVETIVLWWLRWARLGRAALDALVMNVASTVVGATLVFAVYELDTLLSVLLGLLTAWGLSTMIEGGVLWLMRREAMRRIMFVSAIANAASYLILTGLFLLSAWDSL